MSRRWARQRSMTRLPCSAPPASDRGMFRTLLRGYVRAPHRSRHLLPADRGRWRADGEVIMGMNGSTAGTMTGAWLPGDSTVELRQVPVPTPGPGQVLLRMRASTICGSDLRAIYHGHVGPEPYDDVIAGHEPCGEVVEASPGGRLRTGDRVVVYHIVGCLRCRACRAGSYITCEATFPVKVAYGYQRDGGHAEYLLAEEQSCLPLPDELSFVDGACVACGFGTAYEAVVRAEICGRDAVLVTGLGPVGMAAGLLAKAMGAERVIGYNRSPTRSDLARTLGAVEHLVRWDLHPESTVTARFPLAKAGDAYELASSSGSGKVAIVMDE